MWRGVRIPQLPKINESEMTSKRPSVTTASEDIIRIVELTKLWKEIWARHYSAKILPSFYGWARKFQP